MLRSNFDNNGWLLVSFKNNIRQYKKRRRFDKLIKLKYKIYWKIAIISIFYIK